MWGLASGGAGMVGHGRHRPSRRPGRRLRGPQPPSDAGAPAGLSQAILDSTVDGVIVVDGDGRVTTANPAAERMFGWAGPGLVGRDVSDLVAAPVRDRHRRLVATAQATSPRIMGKGRDLVGRRRDGSMFPLEVTLTEVQDAGRRLVCAVVRDITERQEYEARLTHLSMHDPLTGLGNRALLTDRLEQALRRGDRRAGLLAVVLCDLDDFKAVNDSLGHGAGDRLLVEIAGRLREAVRPEDTTVRLGGDEFVVVAEQLRHADDALAVAERVLAEIRRPVLVDDVEVYPSASIGVAVAGGRASPEATEAGGVDELVGNADLALYAAKAAGRSRVVAFEPRMRARERGRIQLRADLHRAVQRGELTVHYQPIVDLSDGTVVGAEALVRWQHPERGLLGPGAFLPLADDSELAVDVDHHVLVAACRDVVRLSEAAGRPLEAWVNVGARTLASTQLSTIVAAGTALAGLPPSMLTVEVTETAMLTDLATTAQALADLRALGAGLAVDDFGTGHTALTYLTRLPVTAVKLDRSFVHRVEADPVDRAVVTGVAGLSEAIGLTTVAEGVERPEQLEVVTASGCHRAQGFLLSPPLPVEALLPVLAARA